jgi:streptogramin lyase
MGLLALAAIGSSAQGATILTHPIGAGGPHAVAPTPDGTSVYVGARDCGYVGRYDIAAQTFTNVIASPPLPCGPDGAGSGTGVFSSVVGPDGKIWFTLYDPGAVNDNIGAYGRVNADGTGFQTQAVGNHPLDITVGPDGNIWFTENGPPGRVVRVITGAFTTFTAFNVPGNVQGPRGIVNGGDGNLYVLGGEAGKIWRVTMSGVITQVATGLAGPSFGELGPDGKIWFTLFEGSGVNTFDPSNSAVGTAIPVSGEPWDVAFGDDGKAYVTRFNGSSIAQIVPGAPGFTTLPLPTAGEFPAFISRSPNGNLYAAGKGTNKLFELIPDVPPRVTTGEASGITETTAQVAATADPRGAASTVSVDYGTTTDYGQTATAADAGNGTSPQAAQIQLTGLAPGTLYHYRATATNVNGTTKGTDGTLTTVAAPSPPATDGDPPETTLKKKPKKRSTDRTPTFKAVSSEAGSSFRCKVDRKPFKPCDAKETFRVKPGKHTVQIAAVDAAGNIDPTPVKVRFKVLEKRT